MTTRLGMIGFNAGNGHPYSFSAIINGYEPAAMRAAGWGVIADYLEPHAASPRVGWRDARVTAVWGPERAQAEQLARTCDIAQVVDDPAELIEVVDAVVIARDDWACHLPLAAPLLEAGLAVFVDKPLTLDPAELAQLRPHLASGRLATWTGLRFAPELAQLRELPTPALVRGIGVETWDRYAIHLLEPALEATNSLLDAAHQAVAFRTDDGRLLQVDVLGRGAVTGLHLEVAARPGHRRATLQDRFTAFETSLRAFVEQVRTGRPAVEPTRTVDVLRALIAGHRALEDQRPVLLSEVAT